MPKSMKHQKCYGFGRRDPGYAAPDSRSQQVVRYGPHGTKCFYIVLSAGHQLMDILLVVLLAC